MTYEKGLVWIFVLFAAYSFGVLIAARQEQVALDAWRAEQQAIYDNRGAGCFTGGGQPR